MDDLLEDYEKFYDLEAKFYRNIELYNLTVNRSMYNKLHKWFLTNNSLVNCHICRYHKGENSIKTKVFKTWKHNRRTQYK